VLAVRRRSLLGSCPLRTRRKRRLPEPDRVDIAYNGITVCVGGVAAPVHDAEALAKSMQQTEIEVVADLRLGNGEATVTTVDLTPGYIDENMRTS
jgi:glutamate N-acetyltransferase/amino-acid N-acetyltransferase